MGIELINTEISKTGADRHGPIVAIGNFDGAHRGHAAVVEQARRLADACDGAPVAALTFEPHPRLFFRPDQPLFLLTPGQSKLARLARLPLDRIITLQFNAALAETSAEAFLDDILIGRLGARGIVVGEDFHFGKNRLGTPDFLRQAAPARGLKLAFAQTLQDRTGAAISSSAIRQRLAEGDVIRANQMLGYRFSRSAPVIHGEKRGRTLGYPTANMRLEPAFGLRHGIYAVEAIWNNRRIGGVASFGRRPTFDNGSPLLETFLFDFSDTLYGETVEIEFVAFLRGEEKFSSLDALVAQMDRDQAAARAILAN
jgi:riboflavin kinase/FMN adenylyltransferase